MDKIPPGTILQWAIELCDVIAYLHEHEPEPIIFRDVKPSNVMIDQHGNVRLIDFGIAKVFESGRKGTMIGTEGYSAPEQYKGEATPASDIYAIGATLHHVVTRRDPRLEPPFSFSERPIRKYNTLMSAEFERIIMKALAYDAAERFASAREMKEALESLAYAGRPGPIPDSAGAPGDEFVAGGGSAVTPLWRFRCEDEIRSSPAVHNGMLYVGAYDNNLYALQASDGAFKWKFATEGGLAASPVVDPQNQIVIIGSEDSVVYAIEMRTGRIVWTIMANRPVRCTARIAHEHVFFGSDDGKLYAAKANNGRVLWKYDAAAPIRTRPWVTDEFIIFGSEAGEVIGLDLGGTPKWRFRAKRGVTSSPAVHEGVVYFGSSDWHVYAVDIRTGYSIWRFRTQKPVWSSPAIDPVTKTMFIGSVDGNLYALDIESGKERWHFTTENQITSSPAVANGAVYIGGIDRNVYSINIKTGEMNWNFTTEGPVASSPEVADNVVYVGSSDHYVYALPA